jgi:hypothetical protein
MCREGERASAAAGRLPAAYSPRTVVRGRPHHPLEAAVGWVGTGGCCPAVGRVGWAPGRKGGQSWTPAQRKWSWRDSTWPARVTRIEIRTLSVAIG